MSVSGYTANVLGYNEQKKVWWDVKHNVPHVGQTALPNICYAFIEEEYGKKFKDDTVQTRRNILETFGMPHIVSSKFCTDMNGYFGCQSSFDETSTPPKLDGMKMWLRCITKKVLHKKNDRDEIANNGGKDYKWYEVGIFIDWKVGGTSRVLCIDTPVSLREGLWNTLQKMHDLELVKDPFALLHPLIDELVQLYNDCTWRMNEMVRHVEKNRQERHSFEHLSNLMRHLVHQVEVESVAVATLARVLAQQEKTLKLVPDISLTYRTRREEYLDFQRQLIHNLMQRTESTRTRLQSEIVLAYNLLASSDNAIVKSITLLTMIFLPGTFVSALFSTTFFDFQVEEGRTVSSKFWLYWVIVIPMTVVVLVGWWLRMGGSYRNLRQKIIALQESGQEKKEGNLLEKVGTFDFMSKRRTK